MTGWSDVRIGWGLVVLEVTLVYALVLAPLQRSLTISTVRAQNAYDLAQRRTQTARAFDAMTVAQRRFERDLVRYALDGRSDHATAHLLLALQAESRAYRVAVTHVEPQQSATDLGASGTQRLEIGLRGRYRDVLAAIAELPLRGTPVEIGSVSLTTAPALGISAPPVLASVQVTLYAGRNALFEDSRRVTAAAK